MLVSDMYESLRLDSIEIHRVVTSLVNFQEGVREFIEGNFANLGVEFVRK